MYAPAQELLVQVLQLLLDARHARHVGAGHGRAGRLGRVLGVHAVLGVYVVLVFGTIGLGGAEVCLRGGAWAGGLSAGAGGGRRGAGGALAAARGLRAGAGAAGDQGLPDIARHMLAAS